MSKCEICNKEAKGSTFGPDGKRFYCSKAHAEKHLIDELKKGYCWRATEYVKGWF